MAGLGKNEDVRERQGEFDEQGPVPVARMLADIDQLMLEVEAILDNATAADLLEKFGMCKGFKNLD